jgi:hypothetical protein
LKYSDFSQTRPFRAAFFIWQKVFMKISGSTIKDSKQRGEWAELRFMARASEHGIFINKPWGDSRRYDFISEHGTTLMRVQVKSTTSKRGKSYVCNISRSGHALYNSEQIDVLAIYVIPKNIWYVIPAVLTNNKRSLILSPHREVSKYSGYEEAWHLLKVENINSPIKDETIIESEPISGSEITNSLKILGR